MKSTRLNSGLRLGRGRVGLRIVGLGAPGIVGVLAMLALPLLGGVEAFRTQAEASGHGETASVEVQESKFKVQGQNVIPGALCSSLSFAQAVNYGVGTLPFSVVAADLNGDSILDLATAN